MREIIDTLIEWKSQNKPFALCLLFRAQHSSPRMPGARLAVNIEGESVGAISMGCIENDLREHARASITEQQSRIVHYDAADSEGLEVGLSCGGIIDVLVAPCPIDDPVISMLDKITGDKPAVLGTVIESCPRLQHMLICEDGHTAGAMVYSSGPERLQLHARQLLKSGGYILDVNTDDPPVFLEALLPSPSLAIVGATPLAVAVCQAAQLAGFRTCIIDPREIEGNMRCTLAASNTHIVHKWPEEAFQKLNVDTSWYTAILSHDSKIDVPALRSAITRKCRYIGLLGSTRTQAQRCQTLLDEGFAPEQLECIHGPIGLSINALSFEEIAIATVAEMISVRRS